MLPERGKHRLQVPQGVRQITVHKDEQILLRSREAEAHRPTLPSIIVKTHDRGTLQSFQPPPKCFRRTVGRAVIHHDDRNVPVFGQKGPDQPTHLGHFLELIEHREHQQDRGGFVFFSPRHRDFLGD